MNTKLLNTKRSTSGFCLVKSASSSTRKCGSYLKESRCSLFWSLNNYTIPSFSRSKVSNFCMIVRLKNRNKWKSDGAKSGLQRGRNAVAQSSIFQNCGLFFVSLASEDKYCYWSYSCHRASSNVAILTSPKLFIKEVLRWRLAFIWLWRLFAWRLVMCLCREILKFKESVFYAGSKANSQGLICQ